MGGSATTQASKLPVLTFTDFGEIAYLAIGGVGEIDASGAADRSFGLVTLSSTLLGDVAAQANGQLVVLGAPANGIMHVARYGP